MAVPTAFSQLSTTASSNDPADSEAVSQGDDHLRQVYAFIRSLYEGASNGQLVFPASQNASSNANTLDDYEEGTWTPALSGVSLTYGSQTGTYTKIGRQVTVHCYLTWTAKTGSGNIGVSGLPFAVASTRAIGAVGFCIGITPPKENLCVVAAVGSTGLYSNNFATGAAATQLTQAHLADAGELQFSLTYEV